MEFDYYLETPCKINGEEKLTLRDIIFNPLEHRPENCKVILSHIGDLYVEITLQDLRYITCHLAKKIEEKGLRYGDTVMLLSSPGGNELITSLFFTACTAMGIRVFLPMYSEVKEMEQWIDATNTKAVIFPFAEINNLKGYEREKEIAAVIKNRCLNRGIAFYDSMDSFNILSLIEQVKKNIHEGSVYLNGRIITPRTEAVIVTTSGTSGKTKLVVYNHGAYALSCLSWQEAGLFKPELFGNTGFTPMFTHTIGIRSFINALWIGHPVCLIITDWFHKHPEQVRYFLLKMKPAHIIGGPAMFNLLIEFYRYFPELKQELNKYLKAFISIGAPFSETTASLLRSITGIAAYNAFGTTETQMACINMNYSADQGHLGDPLPGVRMGLIKIPDSNGFYKLYLSTPYGCAGIIDKTNHDNFFYTGDLVTVTKDGKVVYAGRENDDFLKDDFGVKIPLSELKRYYTCLYAITDHIEWVPVKNKPGLAALLFLNDASKYLSPKEVSAKIKNINRKIKKEIEPFEYSHRHIIRIATVTDNIPITRKGTVSQNCIVATFHLLIEDLKNPSCMHDKIEIVEKEEDTSSFHEYINPELAKMLKALGMDVVYHRAEKDYLYYHKAGKEIGVLDLAGGYGSNLLGHNHPVIKNAVIGFISQNKVSIHSQASIQDDAGMLGEKLNVMVAARTGKRFKVQYGNSGSEAMEIALHHAYFEWRKKIEKLRDDQLQIFGAVEEFNVHQLWKANMKIVEECVPHIIGIIHGFHGYTSGARSMLGNKKRRSYFSGLLKVKPLLFDDEKDNWKNEINNFLQSSFVVLKKIARKDGAYLHEEFRQSTIFTSVIEPVFGEGGIRSLNSEIADYLSKLPFPLISDEIQCGLGRTGSIPAYDGASYYLFGKALGGGIEKISAVLIDDKRFQSSFPKYYSTTFSNGGLAACTASATLDVISRENLPEMAEKKGNYLKNALLTIAYKHPRIIAEIKGDGLMLGIYFNKQMGIANNLLRILFELELTGYFFAAWIFARHTIRILPSLSSPNSWRVEPSCYITHGQIDNFCNGLDELCRLCEEGKTYNLFSFLMDNDVYDDRTEMIYDGNFPSQQEEPLPGALKVGFISHFAYPLAELKIIEPGLDHSSDTGLRLLFNKMQILMDGKPIKILAKNLMKGKVHFTFYLLPFDAAQLENAHKWGKRRNFITKVQHAVDLLAIENVTHVSLGAYASILTNNGLALAEYPSLKIITGNTLTVVSCLHHLYRYVDRLGNNPKLKVAIVGVTGNIGNGLIDFIMQDKRLLCSFLLLGNNKRRLQEIKTEFLTQKAGNSFEMDTDLFRLQEAHVIISCTNTNDPVIFPHHLNQTKPVYIIDISAPAAIAREVRNMPNISICKEASHIMLPDDQELLISTHTPKGAIFCCAAEVLLAALYNTNVPLKGRVNHEAINTLYSMAKEQRFLV